MFYYLATLKDTNTIIPLWSRLIPWPWDAITCTMWSLFFPNFSQSFRQLRQWICTKVVALLSVILMGPYQILGTSCSSSTGSLTYFFLHSCTVDTFTIHTPEKDINFHRSHYGLYYHDCTPGKRSISRVHTVKGRGSIPVKVGLWVGLRIFSYVPTSTKLTNAISKTQVSGPKKGVFSLKIPRKCPFFVFGVF